MDLNKIYIKVTLYIIGLSVRFLNNVTLQNDHLLDFKACLKFNFLILKY